MAKKKKVFKNKRNRGPVRPKDVSDAIKEDRFGLGRLKDLFKSKDKDDEEKDEKEKKKKRK